MVRIYIVFRVCFSIEYTIGDGIIQFISCFLGVIVLLLQLQCLLDKIPGCYTFMEGLDTLGDIAWMVSSYIAR